MNGQLEVEPLAVRDDRVAVQPHVAAVAEAHDLETARRYGSSSASPAGHDRAVATSVEQLRLGARHALQRADLLEVDRRRCW